MYKRIVVLISAAAVIVVIIVAAVILISGAGADQRREVPDFILPESSDQKSAESGDISQASSEASADSAKTTQNTSATNPENNSEEPSITETTTVPMSDDAPSEITDPPAESSALSTTATNTETAHTTTSTAKTTAPEEIIPDNVLVTSCDPLHYIRFEFQPDRILFSGVYSGDEITDVFVMQSTARCEDLTSSGSSFSGSIDVSFLKTGYHIIQVKLSHSIMNYVFETTAQGARLVPEDMLPAEKNLKCADNPLELPAEGVLQHITVSGDKEKAAEILRQIQELSDEICAGITNDFDKARALSDWVSHNIYYDHDASENGVTEEQVTLEYVLKYHRSVCFGWSNLYSALCQAQGIMCCNANGSIVTGSRCFPQTETADERAHSWNMVIIDGQKLWVDTVWDSNNSYNNGRYSEGSVNFKFFGITNELLAHDHRVTRFEHRDYFSFA